MTDPLNFIQQLNFGWVLPFLFIITVIVFFHELGHFLVARWCGVAVETFSIGFGPELVGFTDRKGTRWRISAIPLGGYVKFLGDYNIASAPDRDQAIAGMDPELRARSFIGQPVRKRAAIVAAGPAANFVLAIVIFTVLFMFAGRLVTPPVLDEVLPDTPAAAAGFEPGDRVISIDGHRIESFGDMGRYINFGGGAELTFVVERNGEEVTLTVAPRLEEAVDELGNPYQVGRIGVQTNVEEADLVYQRYPFFQAVGMGVDQIWFTISATVGYIADVVRGRESLDQISGPVTVARVAQKAAEVSFGTLLSLAAFVSISIGFVNLLPIPLLDGGHLLFQGIEAIRRRPLSARVQEGALRVGMVLLLMLMVVALRNDFVSLFRYISGA